MSIKAIAANTLTKVKAHSPEILIGVGIVGVVGTVVLACKATLKAQDILDERADSMAKIDQVMDETDSSEYSEEDIKKDRAIVNIKTGVKLAKEYAPAFALGVLSMACIVSSHHILSTRNAALVAAYNVVSDEFKSYRREVVKEYGEEKDKEIRLRTRVDDAAEQEAPFEAAGEHEKSKRNVGRYTRFFDESSREYVRNADYNKAFLLAQQNSANNQLKAYGMLFLNDVYKMLGFDPTPEGSVVGWVYTKENEQFVDFGIYEGDPDSRRFVNGNDPVCLLDFNVQGVVFDML